MEYNVQPGDFINSYYCIVYLKVAKRIDVTSSHHKRNSFAAAW